MNCGTSLEDDPQRGNIDSAPAPAASIRLKTDAFEHETYTGKLKHAPPNIGGACFSLPTHGTLYMSTTFQIVVCGSIVPDPLQTLEPVTGPAGPALKNEMMLPAVLDPWAAHALYEAAHLAQAQPGSKVWLVGMAPRPSCNR